MRIAPILLTFLLWLPATHADEVTKPFCIRPVEAAHRVGDKVMVEGTVATVKVTKRGRLLLNFGAAYPNQAFTAVVRKIEAAHTEEVMKRHFAGKVVQVSGLVTLYQGKPQIEVKRWDDCKIPTIPIFKN